MLALLIQPLYISSHWLIDEYSIFLNLSQIIDTRHGNFGSNKSCSDDVTFSQKRKWQLRFPQWTQNKTIIIKLKMNPIQS